MFPLLFSSFVCVVVIVYLYICLVSQCLFIAESTYDGSVSGWLMGKYLVFFVLCLLIYYLDSIV